MPWLFLLGWVLTSGLIISPLGDAAVRGALFSIIVTVLAASVVATSPDEHGLVKAISIAAGLILILSFAGLVLLPDAAVHTAAEFEPQHSGLWRGVFFHKNVAGPAMAPR